MPIRLFHVIIVTSVCLIVGHRANHAEEKNPRRMVDVKAEVARLLETSDYPTMTQYPDHWSKDMTAADKKQIVVELSSRLMNIREVPLKNYADMIVHSRLTAGKMRFGGHGSWLVQDVFLENGRCAWAIERMLNCRLPEFSVGLNENPEKLAEAVRQSLLKVIDAMAIPGELNEPFRKAMPKELNMPIQKAVPKEFVKPVRKNTIPWEFNKLC